MKDYTVLDGQITCLRNKLYDEAYQRGYEDGHRTGEIDGVMNIKVDEVSYQRGLEDAWECARKLHKYKNTEIMEIFGLIGLTLGDGCRNEVIQNCSVSEAMQKIKDYEERKTDEIKVGDEVKVYDDCIGIVTRHSPQARTCYVMYRDGSCGEEELTDCKKTGNHSMSLDKWLEQMRKERE